MIRNRIPFGLDILIPVTIFVKKNVSIEVQDLTRYYGEYKALDSISFKAVPGKILGFLGPNGAGKSTTMKILTGFLPASSGQVRISGLDIHEDSLKARSLMGYLPENNPLYPDMYITEFLGFVADIFRIRNKKGAVLRVLDQTGLGNMRGKKIGQLSKGYRQRVGLAQALISDPSVLILDEPTSGLDPNQLTEVRNLILELGKDKTVILSTHIMQEVESVCDQVVILNLGKIVANDSVSKILERKSDVFVYILELNQELDESVFYSLPHVLEVKKMNIPVSESSSQAVRYSIQTSSTENIRESLFDLAVKKNRILLGLKKEEMDLTHVFQNLTQNKA
jgi:ABC-2 type transport system ATP-binding protein